MMVKLKDVIIDIINPINVRTVEEGGNVRVLVPSSIENDTIKEELFKEGEIDLIRMSSNYYSKYYLKKGDIVFQAKSNKFEAILIEEDYDNLVASTLYFVIRVNRNRVNPKYLQWILKTKKTEEYFERNTSGSVMRIVRKSILEEFEFSCPSLNKQEELEVLIRCFEIEKKETLKYLNSKEEVIERKILEKYEVK